MPRGTANTAELSLLAEALSTQGESEGDGVKYIYMDDQTVYRFENNRMKKVSAAMIKKANKLLEQQSVLPNDTPANLLPKQAKQRTTRAKASKVIPEPSEDVDEDNELPPREAFDREEDDDEPAPPPVKRAPAKRATTTATTRKSSKVSDAANIDLNEYYNNKNKMEYMTLEIDRLNNKINKLKQYKSIVNKITGGEYDPDIQVPQYPPQQVPPQYQQYPNQREALDRRSSKIVNDDLFNFN